MDRQSSHSMQVVKREDKEAKLAHFILGEIAAGRVSLSGEWTIVALSMESPVLKALRRVVNDLEGAPDLCIRVIATAPGKHVVGDGFETIGSLDLRRGTRSQLLDAHEQLVLGAASSWTGDCMRRDPCERDAFEMFGGGSEELSDWARKSFERIWSGAAPVKSRSHAVKPLHEAADADGVIAGDNVGTSAMVAATSRH